MEQKEALKIARETMSKAPEDIDLSMYSKEEQELINEAIDYLDRRVDAQIEEYLLENRGAFCLKT